MELKEFTVDDCLRTMYETPSDGAKSNEGKVCIIPLENLAEEYRRFLKTEFPMQYQILLMTGGLSAHLKKTEKAAQALKRRLTAEVLSDNSSSNYLKNLQDNRMAEMEIERTILEEIVYQPLETTD